MAVYMSKLLPVGKELQKMGLQVYETVPAGKKALKILVLNMMTTIEKTERGIIEKLSLSDVDTELTFIHTEKFLYSKGRQNEAIEHYSKYYKPFSEIKDEYFDGLIITGAPAIPGPDNMFWDEYKEIDTWAKEHVKTEFHICWGAFGSIMQRYDAQFFWYDEKLHGVFKHEIVNNDIIFNGLSNEFLATNSREIGFDEIQLSKKDGLIILAKTEKGGPTILRERDYDVFYSLSHFDYVADTLENEYLRDIQKGKKPHLPSNYYVNDDPDDRIRKESLVNSFFIFDNWLNYYCKK